jgi:beta-1,4-mannosyltransferase
VRLAERYERYLGRTAHASLCVTRAMQAELARHWGVPATVFYDRPPDFFRAASLQVKVAECRGGAGGSQTAAAYKAAHAELFLGQAVLLHVA